MLCDCIPVQKFHKSLIAATVKTAIECFYVMLDKNLWATQMMRLDFVNFAAQYLNDDNKFTWPNNQYFGNAMEK